MIFADAKQLLWLFLLIGMTGMDYFLERVKNKARAVFLMKNWDRKKYYGKKALFFAALFFLILAMARPQWGKKEEILSAPGMDIVFAIDVSKSMLVKDLKPNRLENAKTALSLLSSQLAGNRVALVAFAGSSFIECPLTPDIDAVKLFLHDINVNLIPVPGTDIGGAIHASAQALGEAKNSKAIILITDGEDLSGGARSAVAEAAGKEIRIYPVGIGTPLGEPVPGLDKKGEIVVSRLDANLLNEIAQKTGGKAFFVGEGNSALPELMAAIAGLPKSSLKHAFNYEYKDRFPIFIFLSLFCLIAEFMISDRRVFLILLSAVLISPAHALPFRSDINKGNDFYLRGQFEKAEGKYFQALQKKKTAVGLFNLGDALYEQGKFAEGERNFALLTGEARDNKIRQKAFYNLGNAQFRQENYEGAVKSYEESLKIDTNDADARYNLELAKKILKMPKNKRPKQNPKNKKEDNKKEKQKGGGKKENKPQPKQGLNREDAERILQGISGEDKHKGKKAKAGKGENDLDW